MPTNYEREEAIRRAEGMLNGGFETEYIYGKLLKEGFEETDAAGIIQRLTGKPFKPSAKPASTQAASSLAELPNFSNSAKPAEPVKITKPEPAPSKAVEPLSSPPPAAPVEEPSTLAELLNVSQTSSPVEAASTTAESASPIEVPDPSAESFSAAQPESSAEAATSLAELVNNPEAPAASPSPAATTPQRPTKTSELDRREAAEKARVLRESGYNPNFIYQRLINDGYSHEIAQSVLLRLTGNQFGKPITKAKNDVGTYRRTPYTPPPGQASSNSDGGTQVMLGIAMIVIGCGITFFSYQAAANSPTGGTYVVTFGLIIMGVIRVIRGLSN